MKLAGFLLMIAGWIIVLAAIALFPAPTPRGVFAAAGIAIEIAGLVCAARSHAMRRGAARGESE